MSADRDGLGTLVQRMYQEELAQHARDRNTILAVDTGTGKTLIAALVIRWKLAIDRMNLADGSEPIRKVRSFTIFFNYF
jgi:replicative superfamily II helicase